MKLVGVTVVGSSRTATGLVANVVQQVREAQRPKTLRVAKEWPRCRTLLLYR